MEPSLTAVSFVREAFSSNRGSDLLTGIIGPGCSSSAIGLAPLVNRSNLSLVMVHGAGSPILADHDNFRFSFGTLGASENFVKGFIYLADEAQWTRVAVLFDDTRMFYKNTKSLLDTMLLERNVTIEFASPVSSTYLPLDTISDLFIRIVAVLCPIGLSRQIICLSYHREMNYSNYQWIFFSQILQDLREPPEEFVYEGMRYNCSEEEMTIALNMSLFMIYRLTPNDSSLLLSNTTYLEYLQLYEDYRASYNMRPNITKHSSYSYWATYLYDAVWAWGKVLDTLTRREDFQLNKHDYRNIIQTQMIAEEFYRTSFHGMSGFIRFDRNSGFPQPVVNLSQIENGSEVHIAYIGESDVVVNVEADPKIIPDRFDRVAAAESIVVGTCFTFIVILQLIATVSMHIFTTVNSGKPSIKASCPKLLHVSFVGTYILIVAVLLYQLVSVHAIEPNARCIIRLVSWAWLFPIGFTLAFGPVAMRTWRLYRIFQHYLNPGPLITNKALFGAILLLALADVVIGKLWTSLDRFKPYNDTQFSAPGALVTEKTDCRCDHYELWFGMILAHKLSLLLVVALLAFLTRNIPNRSFTTNALQVLAYITAITFVLGFSVHYIVFRVSFHPNNKFSVFLLVQCLLISVFIVCIFVPPVSPILVEFYKSRRKIL